MRDRNALSDEGAASSAIAFIIAGVLFLAAITLVLYVTNNKVAAEKPARAISGNAIPAQSILDLLLSPADSGVRPSLVNEDGVLDEDLITAFDGLDPEEVRDAFGLDTADPDGVPLTLHVTIDSDDPAFVMDFGDPIPASSSVGVEPASLQVRIPGAGSPGEVPTAVVTVYVFPYESPT